MDTNKITHCFVGYANNWRGATVPMVIDVINPETGTGAYGGKRIEDYANEYTDVRVVTFEEYDALHEQAWRQAPQRITRQDYIDALEVLPPSGWVHGEGNESFKCCERLSGKMTNIYARIGDTYYQMVDAITMRHADIIAACAAA